MTLFKKAAIVFAALALSAAFCACGGGDDEGGEGGGGIDVPKPSTTLTPEDVKETIEDAVVDFLQKMAPSTEHRQLSALAQYVDEHYSALDIPDEWAALLDEDDEPVSAANVVYALAKGAKTRSLAALSRALPTYRLGQFAGIYEPGVRNWVKTGESQNIVFLFNGPKGKCELTVAGSGTPWSVNTEEAIVEIPGEIAIRLTEASSALANVTLKTFANLNAMTANVDAQANLAGIEIAAKMQMSNTVATETESVGTNGSVHQRSEATINGTNMLNEEITPANLNNGRVTISILDKVTVQANADINQLYRRIGNDDDFGYWSSWDDYSEPEARQYCANGCAILNQYVNGSVMIGSDRNNTQATLNFMPAFYDYNYDYGYSEWSWEIQPVLVYADGSSQTFEQIAETTDLWRVEQQWDLLISTYQRLWSWLQ